VLRDVASYLAVFATVAAVALAGLAAWLTLTLRRLQAGQRAVLGPHGRRDIVAHVGTLEEQVRNLRNAVEMLTGSVEDYRHDLDGSLSNLALVRFNAFRDTGGEQSCSAAMLDNYRSGIVLTIIASRDTARLYVKHLSFGRPDRELSPEEEEAVRRAVPSPLRRDQLSGPPVPTLPRRLPVWEAAEEDQPPQPIEGQEEFDLDELPDSALEPHPWRQGQTGAGGAAARGAASGAETPGRPALARVQTAAVSVDNDHDDRRTGAGPVATSTSQPPARGPATVDEAKSAGPAGDAGDEQPAARHQRRPEDWLGGDELEF
jgi:hypothetical protein